MNYSKLRGVAAWGFVVLLMSVLSASAAKDDQGFVRTTPEEIQWKDVPNGMGVQNAIGLKPGSFMKHPAGGHHFDGAKDEEVILQIIGMGPSGTTRLRPEEGSFGTWTKK
jgi:hypothetical protein